MPHAPDRHPELPLDPDPPELATPPRALHLRPAALLLVAIGGVAGTLSRYGLAEWQPSHTGRWPWGTFTANLAGAFVLGVLLELLARLGADEGPRQRARLLLGTGFCGALTTYSTLAVETDLLIHDHRTGLGLGYLAASVVAGLLVTVVGVGVAAGHHARRRGRAA